MKTPNHCSTAREAGLIRCPCCHSIVEHHHSTCPVCGSNVSFRTKDSLQKTLAWLITSVILYIPANVLPVMTTQTLTYDSANTIASGIIELWTHGSYLIASVIFFASLIVPIGKILILGYLCLCIIRKDAITLKTKTRAFEITEALGKWSMIDVFVVLTLVSLVQLGHIASIQSNPGILAFAGVVIATMMAARSFDIRLLWDSATEPSIQPCHLRKPS